MKLAMAHFKQAQTTIEDILSKTALIDDAEEALRIREDLVNLNTAFGTAIENLEAIEAYDRSIKTCGFSDKWFETVNANGEFTKLVSLDIPKFIDNKARSEACIEGIGESIKNWVKAAWEILKKFFVWVAEKIHELVSKLNAVNTNCGIIHSFINKVGDQIDKKLWDKYGLNVKDFRDLDLMKTHLTNTITFLDMFRNQYWFVEGLDTLNDKIVTKENATEMVIGKIKSFLEDNHFKTDDAAKVGFEVKKDEVVFFSGEYPITSIVHFSKEKVDKLLEKAHEVEGVFSDSRAAYTFVVSALTTERNRLQKIVDGEAVAAPDKDHANPVLQLTQANIMLSIVARANSFVFRVAGVLQSNLTAIAKAHAMLANTASTQNNP